MPMLIPYKFNAKSKFVMKIFCKRPHGWVKFPSFFSKMAKFETLVFKSQQPQYTGCLFRKGILPLV